MTVSAVLEWGNVIKVHLPWPFLKEESLLQQQPLNSAEA